MKSVTPMRAAERSKTAESNVGSLRLERRIDWQKEGMCLCFSSTSVVRVPVRIDLSTRAAITRESDTRIVEVAESPPIRIIVGIKVG